MANTILLEARPFRPFKSSEEYLVAMREDLAEWLNCLYPELCINFVNFMDKLDTGVALCKHANNVRAMAESYVSRRLAKSISSSSTSLTTSVKVHHQHLLSLLRNQEDDLPILPAARPGTFFARDNVSNFIAWCRRCLGIHECLLFETDDLIMRKNEKHVILCLLEVARRGAKFGMLAPMLVQMERQIDREIAADNLANTAAGSELNSTDGQESDTDSENDRDADGVLLVYGPHRQIVTNDLKSLDEMVRELVERCTCPSQFPMVRVSEGKYRIGDTKVLIFVRILRSHVMVRVGGGWDTLSHYLDKHDPCRCRAQHRTSQAARLIQAPQIRNTRDPQPYVDLSRATVIYDRSPPSARRVMPNVPESRVHDSTISPTGHLYKNNATADLIESHSNISSNTNNNGGENCSDNGSEVSDEGYRSLGLVKESCSSTAQTKRRHSKNEVDGHQEPSDCSPISSSDDSSKVTTKTTPKSNGSIRVPRYASPLNRTGARNRAESPSITRINQRTSNNSTNNTWSGARTKTKQRSTITPETFERNSPTRKSTSLNGSPTKTNSKIRTPLAKQLLHTAQTATNEDELLAQMKQLLLNYDRNDDITAVGCRIKTCVSPRKDVARDRSASRIPAPVRAYTELY
uniref:Proteinral transcriptional corepressor trfa n=1 Tax=Xenopsylla cheopis TaxID=163159 RepID=A0A6M2DGF1_XENCH